MRTGLQLPDSPRTDPGVRFSPHRALRECSLPQQAKSACDQSSPCSLSPTVGFALLSVPSCTVSVSFVGFVSRQPLPLVNGSPAL